MTVLGAIGALTDGGNANAEQFAWIALGGALYIAVGAGIGVGIDALIKGHRVVYDRRFSRSSAELTIAPVLSGRQQGVMVSMKF